MNILRFFFFLPLLLCSVLLSARVVEVKDSVRAEEPVVWSEDFSSAPASTSPQTGNISFNNRTFQVLNGYISTAEDLFGADNQCVILKTNGVSGNNVFDQVASFTTPLMPDCQEVRFKIKKKANSFKEFPQIYLAILSDEPGKAWTRVQTATIKYSVDNETWLDMEWKDFESLIYTDDSYTITFSVTFSAKNRYIRWCAQGATGAQVYIDDIEIVCKPWIYSTHEETVWDYTQSVNVGDLGIVCRDKAIESGNYEGVEFYRVAYRVGTATNPTDLVVEQVENLEAGVPYIYYATATQMSWDESGEAVATAGTSNGLHGTLTGITDGNQLNGKWVFYNNQLMQIGDASCIMGANKGYIDMSEVCEQSEATLVPGRKMMSVNRSGSVTTGTNGEIGTLYSSYTHRILRRGNRLVILQGDKMVDILGNVIR